MGVRVREKPPGSGTYWIFINHNGKRKAKQIGKDKRLARNVAEKINAKLVLGEYELDNSKEAFPIFKDYAEHWLALPHDFKDATGDEYRSKLNLHIYPVIGKTPVNEIDKKCLQALFDGLLIKGFGSSTIGSARAIISEVLKHALAGDLIDRNPIKDLQIKRNKNSATIEPLTEAEANQLLEASQKYNDGEFYPMFLTALRTGLRIGEIIGLKWTEVDFDKRMIEVKQTLGWRGFSTPKNGKFRRVDMTPLLADVLKQSQIDQKKSVLKNRHAVPEFVFTRENGEHHIYHYCRRALVQCLKLAELRHIRMHDLRHSYATIRLLRGHNIGDISYQMGHSSISITYDIYGHWIPGRFKSEVDDLDNAQPNATYTQPEINHI